MALCLWYAGGSAQSAQQSGLHAFRVRVPDGEIVQGDRIQVVYELEATNWSITSFNGGVDCGQLVKLDSEKSELGGGVRRMLVTATFRITGAGQLKVRPMSVFVDGKTVLSDEAEINVIPHPEYGSQWQIAYGFLAGKGVDSPNLAYKYGNETLCAFSDDRNRCFVITVSSKYSRYVDNPVLAYGIGNSMWNGERADKDNTIYIILDQYDRQLKYMRDNNKVYTSYMSSDIVPDPDEVEPLLGDIAYSQDYPYNMYFPKEEYGGKDSCCIAGCGPVALAQILALYRKPVDLKGNAVLTSKSGKRYRIDSGDYPVRWDGSERDIASLMLDCAVSLSAVISPYASSSSLSDFKPSLINDWGYSPQCRNIKGYDDYDALADIYREIDSGRPVLLSDESHIFICDGYSGDYLHFNLGWGGHCNGYYRILVVPSMSGNQLPFSSMLTGVHPLEEECRMSVHVSTPGTLSTLLDESALSSVTSLVVTGQIDGEDIKCLRKMAGAYADVQAGSLCGSLMNLDLSGATIKGGNEYLVRSADGIVLKGFQRDASGSFSYNYNMAEVTDDGWAEITRRGLDKLEGISLFKGNDGHYYASYLTTDDIIGIHMFSDCENLTEIILPKSIKKIGDYAFRNCNALKIVVNKPATVSKTAFQNSGIQN